MTSVSHGRRRTLATIATLAFIGVFSMCEISDGCWTPNESAKGVFKQTKDQGNGKVAAASATMTINGKNFDIKALNAPAKEKAPRTVVHATNESFKKVVLESDMPVLVDFYADWCGPCRMIAPVLQQLAEESDNAKVVKINVDKAPQLVSAYGVTSIPMLLVFKKGKVVKQHVGLTNLNSLKQMLTR